MKLRNNIIEGDLGLWGLLALLALFSFLPVFSASSNLVYVLGTGTPLGHLIKHMIILFFGFILMIGIHKIPPNYFKSIAVLSMPVVIILLIYTVAQGTVIQGANASRWIRIPFIEIGFQTSTLASVVLMVYTARYLDKHFESPQKFKDSILPLWLPIAVILMLILPSNFSTAFLIFLMIIMLVFVGGYPIKHLAPIIGGGILVLVLFILTAKAFPEVIPNRVGTWISRIESFGDNEVYQVERAKIAIATGGTTGVGIGKSVMKNFLPQSSSDFIYAIIVEEFGLIGGIGLIIIYLFILFRIVIIMHKADNVFDKLVVIGVGIPIIFQAFINMGVALQLLPVTGQTLPMISSGGTSAIMTCISFGIILSVSVSHPKREENQDNPLNILSETL